jgi:ribulose 1,5-bisphosphate carboxylase large subunit-like protein
VEQVSAQSTEKGLSRRLGRSPDDYLIKVVSFEEDGGDEEETNFGSVELAIPIKAVPVEHGLPLVIAIVTFASVFSHVVEYQVLDIDFPESHLVAFPGPAYGADRIMSLHQNRRVLIGMVLRPRFHSSPQHLSTYVRDFVEAGVDFVLDDELTTPEPSREFGNRIELIVKAVQKGSGQGKDNRATFIATVTSRTTLAIQLAKQACSLGVDGIMLNPMVMGYDVIQSLAAAADFEGLVVANMIGRSLLTGGRNFRFSPTLLCKLTRLVGADAMYIQAFVGAIKNPRKTAAQYEVALTSEFSAASVHRSSAAIMSGGLGLAEVAENPEIYGGPLMLSIGERCARAWEEGVSAKAVMRCLRSYLDAVATHDRAIIEDTLMRLYEKDAEYQTCLTVFGADEVVARLRV